MSERFPDINSLLGRLDRALESGNRWLIILFVSSFLLKLLYVIQSAESLYVGVPILDSKYYDTVAQDILEGNLVRRDAFFMGPLYPYFLAVVYGVFGRSFIVIRIVQILGGALTVILTYLIGKRVFRPSIALLASVMLALYGTITFYEGHLLMMWLGTLLNMTMIYALQRSGGRGGWPGRVPGPAPGSVRGSPARAGVA